MKLHIIPSPEFTQLLLAIIHCLANQSHKVEPIHPLPAAPAQATSTDKPNATTEELQGIVAAMNKVMGVTKLQANFDAPLPDAHLSKTDPDLDAKISPQVHRILEHAVRIAEACASGPRISIASSDHLLAAILLSTTKLGAPTISRRYLEFKGITLQDLCKALDLPIDRIPTA